MTNSELLIRGLGFQFPGGAPVLPAHDLVFLADCAILTRWASTMPARCLLGRMARHAAAKIAAHLATTQDAA